VLVGDGELQVGDAGARRDASDAVDAARSPVEEEGCVGNCITSLNISENMVG
jgi:hypothetical protein